MGLKSTSDIFIVLSFFAVTMAFISWGAGAVWLAATQWLLVAIVFGVWSLYLGMRHAHECSEKLKVNGKNGSGKKK